MGAYRLRYRQHWDNIQVCQSTGTDRYITDISTKSYAGECTPTPLFNHTYAPRMEAKEDCPITWFWHHTKPMTWPWPLTKLSVILGLNNTGCYLQGGSCLLMTHTQKKLGIEAAWTSSLSRTQWFTISPNCSVCKCGLAQQAIDGTHMVAKNKIIKKQR